MPIKTPEGKWVVFEVATGKQLERWPVDAKHLVADPAYSYAPPEGVEPQVDPGPPTHVGAPKAVTASVFEAPDAEPAKRSRKKAES